MSCLGRLGVVFGLRKFFLWLGRAVAYHPKMTIVVGLGLVGCSAVGLLRFRREIRVEELWYPSHLETVANGRWVDAHFPALGRNVAMIQATNVLRSTVVKKLLSLHSSVEAINMSGSTWADICIKSTSSSLCVSTSLLDLWNGDDQLISRLNDEEILVMVNNWDLKNPSALKMLLGSVHRNSSSGRILGAGATMATWMVTEQKTHKDKVEDTVEAEFVAVVLEASSVVDGIRTFANTHNSFERVSSLAIENNVAFLVAGYGLVVIYVAAMLGRFDSIGHKVYLSLAGIACVGLGLVVAMGVGSATGLAYSPLHPLLPFLLLGIGVDDMFVVVDEWDRGNVEAPSPLEERVARTLERAGVAVTVTSLTNAAALAVGMLTALPALRSFSAFAAVGVLAVYGLQSTLWVACFVLTIRRLNSTPDAHSCCRRSRHGDVGGHEPRLRRFFATLYAPWLLKLPIKVLVVMATVVSAAALGLGGTLRLRREFDPTRYLPKDSYLTEYLGAVRTHFPHLGGIEGAIYIGAVDYYDERSKLEGLYEALLADRTIGDIRSWFHEFYVNALEHDPHVDDDRVLFHQSLREFACNSTLQRDLNVSHCNDDGAFQIEASRLGYRHVLTNSTGRQRIESMRTVKLLASAAGYFALSPAYAQWETDDVIGDELVRNLLLALGSVLAVNAVLVADLRTCLGIVVAIILTLVDVSGVIYFWDLTVDTLTCVTLVLAVGLAVDYSAHFAHAFLSAEGDRRARVTRALGDFGPAVFNGGFTTFLAVAPLGMSDSYVFSTCFKIFFCVVAFGLFHGLVLLPVLFDWMGSAQYPSCDSLEPSEPFKMSPVSTSNGLEWARKAFAGQSSNMAVDTKVVVTGSGITDRPPTPPPDYHSTPNHRKWFRRLF